MASIRYKRIILKVSGELLAGNKEFGLDHAILHRVAAEIQNIHDLGVETGIIVGGGNIFRGLSVEADGMTRIAGDHMGMLATIINAIALQDHLERLGVYTRVCSAINVEEIAEPFDLQAHELRH